MKLKYFVATFALSLMLPLQLLAEPISTSTSTYQAKTCPLDNPFHILVNKKQHITNKYIPNPLVIPNVKFSFSGFHEKKQMQETAALALEELFNGAKAQNIHLVAVSGYRSYNRQSQIYNNYVKRDGQLKADTYSARPGTSEHQTGLSIDVSSASAGYNLTESFGKTKEGIWLANNAHNYGFVIRYPKGKDAITGYIYEPWHIRYVGKELASTLYTNNLTLEELETCCVVEPPIPLTPLVPSTPIVPIAPLVSNTPIVPIAPLVPSTPLTLDPSDLLALKNIQIHIDDSLKNLNIDIIPGDNGINIVITPKTPEISTETPTVSAE